MKIYPFNFHAEGRHDARKLLDFRGGAILRNIGIFLAWDGWNRERMPLAGRCRFMQGCGFDLTEKALQRLVEKSGLTAET